MTSLLISIHVVAGLLFLGPVTVAGSLFPRYARQALGQLPIRDQPYAATRLLHRVTAGYAIAAIAIPVFGAGAASEKHVFGKPWLQAAIVLVVIAAILLALIVLPGQRRVVTELERPDSNGPTTVPSLHALLTRLSMATGLFAVAWVAVAVLMVTKPGGAH
ncbi:MAG TPA: DUF2269 family protein [Streptosporangiaceae bacterium]|nr:DUF2269 family protein [Streptosporangiaceae bacterium]